MSDKPKIYGRCDAGCKWEVPHKDEIVSIDIINNINEDIDYLIDNALDSRSTSGRTVVFTAEQLNNLNDGDTTIVSKATDADPTYESLYLGSSVRSIFKNCIGASMLCNLDIQEATYDGGGQYAFQLHHFTGAIPFEVHWVDYDDIDLSYGPHFAGLAFGERLKYYVPPILGQPSVQKASMSLTLELNGTTLKPTDSCFLFHDFPTNTRTSVSTESEKLLFDGLPELSYTLKVERLVLHF
jgi:hypothetical protein